MNASFKLPVWFPVPQCVFDVCIGLGLEYAHATFSSDVTDEPPIGIWIHENKVISDEEVKKIVCEKTGDISGGYYTVDHNWIHLGQISFAKMGLTENKETIWRVGDVHEIIEKCGVITSHVSQQVYIRIA